VAPQPAAAAADPIERRAVQLEAEGFLFSARAERRAAADADHRARRRAVEEEVSRTERLFEALCRNFGDDYANRFMEGA
jgi:hypothetical protein